MNARVFSAGMLVGGRPHEAITRPNGTIQTEAFEFKPGGPHNIGRYETVRPLTETEMATIAAGGEVNVEVQGVSLYADRLWFGWRLRVGDYSGRCPSCEGRTKLLIDLHDEVKDAYCPTCNSGNWNIEE